MIRLALAVGFLAVFGIVAYVITLLLTNYFKNNNSNNTNNQNN
jgi:phage shock protein PspC (stress-responsive transcriptional regulator)